MKAPKPKSNYEAVPAGTHVARLYQLIHIGTNSFEYKGEVKSSDKVRLTFELPGEMREFKEGEGEKPMTISREFGFSMGKKSHLRPFIEGMLGITMSDPEAYDVDVDTLVGKSCLLSISHTEKDGNTYSNIASASPLMKGMTAPEAINEAKVIDVDFATQEEIEALPEFIREKMKSSEQYRARFADGGEAGPVGREESDFDQNMDTAMSGQ